MVNRPAPSRDTAMANSSARAEVGLTEIRCQSVLTTALVCARTANGATACFTDSVTVRVASALTQTPALYDLPAAAVKRWLTSNRAPVVLVPSRAVVTCRAEPKTVPETMLVYVATVLEDACRELSVQPCGSAPAITPVALERATGTYGP